MASGTKGLGQVIWSGDTPVIGSHHHRGDLLIATLEIIPSTPAQPPIVPPRSGKVAVASHQVICTTTHYCLLPPLLPAIREGKGAVGEIGMNYCVRVWW